MSRLTWRSVAPPTVAITLALGLGAYPAHSARSDVESRRAHAEARIVDLQSQVAFLTPLGQGADDVERELTALDALVPDDFDVAGFVVELDSIARSIGVELRDVVPAAVEADAPRDEATPPGWTAMELSVRIVGRYPDFIAFTEAITETERLAVVDAVNITASGDATLVGDVRLRLFSNDQSPAPLIARYVESVSEETTP